MSAQTPLSQLTTEQLLKIAQFDRATGDALDAALVANAGGGAGSVILYVATGSESPSGFVVPLPQARANTDYHIGFFGVEADIISPVSWECSARTTTNFTMKFSGDGLTAGGLYMFQLGTNL